MRFLVELDHVKTGQPFTEDTARAFVDGIIFPTLDRAEQLFKECRIVDFSDRRAHVQALLRPS
jgi:hypothetical protein